MAGKEALYLECYAGISGDMFVAALLDLGADEETLRRALDSLPIPGFRVEIRRVRKNGLDACDFCVILDEIHENHDHDMAYLYPQHMDVGEDSPRHLMDGNKHTAHHCHRSLRDVLEILDGAQLTQRARTIARRIFQILGEAEAKAHGTTIEQVHFHEVGAIDSIADIAGAAICLEYLFEKLGVSRVLSSKIELGGGVAICDHGALSVPAPAVCEILKGVPVSLGRANFEMTTPTGAAILKVCADEFADSASFKIEKIGYGAGGKDAAGFANVLRAMICEADEDLDERNLGARSGYGEVCKQILISTNIDDMDAESFALACEILRENGALDVFSRSIFMKKGRAGFELNALCRKQDAQNLKDLIFTHTTAIGVREVEVTKTELKREFARVQTKFGEIGLKISGSSQTQKAKPEFNECKAAALAYGTTIERVRKEALKIYDETRKTKG